MTAAIGLRPASARAASIAARLFFTTASMSLTVPDCMCASPCRCRPLPRTTPVSRPSASRSTLSTSALANSVPMSSAAIAGALPRRAALRTRSATRLQSCPTAVTTRGSGRLDALERLECQPPRLAQRLVEPGGVACPPAWARSGRPPPPPPMIGAASRTIAPASKPSAARSRLAATRIDGLPSVAPPTTATNRPVMPRRSSASVRSAAASVSANDSMITFVRPASWALCSAAAASRLARPSRAAPSPPSPPRGGGQQALDALRDGLLALAEQLGGGAQRLEPIGDELGRGLAGDRLDPPQPGSDARLPGDQEQADLPGRGDVRAAAQLLAE